MKPNRSRPLRFEVVADKHDNRVFIDDDDFHWDALLKVHGDFEDFEQKARYARAICDALNAAEDRIPYAPDNG